MPVSGLSLRFCTAFATPNSSSGISYDSGSTSILKRLVSAAKSSGKGTKIVLSIGEARSVLLLMASLILLFRWLGRMLLVLPDDEQFLQQNHFRECCC